MTDAQKPPHSSCDGKTPTLRVPSVLLILFGAFSKLKRIKLSAPGMECVHIVVKWQSV